MENEGYMIFAKIIFVQWSNILFAPLVLTIPTKLHHISQNIKKFSISVVII